MEHREEGAAPARRRAERDEVDRIIADWHAARPGLDVAPLAVFSRIGRLSRMLDLARRRALAAHGIEVWEFDVLTSLRRAEGAGPDAVAGLTPGTLMAEALVSSGTMTNRLHRLVAHGLVTRAPDPADGRAARIHLTDAGRARVDAALDHLLRDEERLLADLDAAERGRLADLLRQILAPMERERR